MPIVVSSGVPIHYEVIGAGPPIVLVHGFASSLEGNWGQTGWLDFLVSHGCTVVGVDCRGHGLSGTPHDPAAYGANQMPDDVLAVMDAAGLEHADIMGYSMGVGIALNLLARFPDRITSLIAGGQGGVRMPVEDPQSRIAIAEALEADDASTISDPRASSMRRFADSRAKNPDSLAGRGNDLLGLGALWRSDVAAGHLLFYVDDEQESILRRREAPVLAVVGENDVSIRASRRLVEIIPHAELVVLPGYDHMSAVRADEYKDAVAAFLTSHRLAQSDVTRSRT